MFAKVCSYRPSGAMLVALLALFFSVGGLGYAKKVVRLIDGHQIKKGTIDANRLSRKARAALKGNVGPRGVQGPKGDQGLPGAKGDIGPAGPATGPAGGDLTGSYPNPTLGAGVVTAGKLAAGAAATNLGPAGGDLTGSFPNPTIAAGKVSGADLNTPMSLSNTDESGNPFVSLSSSGAGIIAQPSNGLLDARRTDTSGVGPAIYGSTNSIFGNEGTAGLFGEATGTGGYGVYALHSSSSGFGRAMTVASNGQGPALEVDANGTGSAAQFSGAVSVTGNLSVSGSITAGVKDFKIDDPADPANKFLIHTAVESPQAENVYNGNLTTDARGYATVRLPSYFDAENTDPRYQLTVIGSFASAVVWKHERNNQFAVRTDQPRTAVSWQVTGVRNDPYARSQRAPAEQPKPAASRGRYLYPQGFGKPAGDTIGNPRGGRTLK